MKQLKAYDIQLLRLKNGQHNYTYEGGSEFFEAFENSPVDQGKLHTKLKLEKTDRHIMANFSIQGHVTLECDRSLETFEFPIAVDQQLIFKYGETYSELSEDVLTIPYDCDNLNVAQYIFEYVGLEIPMKKLHPRFDQEKDEDEEDEIFFTSETEPDDESNDDIDPRWEALKSLKNRSN